MTAIPISDLLLDQLAAEGAKYIFGNPGAGERPIMQSLTRREDIPYVLCLTEGIAVSMACGHAQATGRAAVVNLSAESGVTDGLSALSNAWAGRVPLVVMAGQRDTRTLNDDPTINIVPAQPAQPFCKLSLEMRHSKELPRLIRQSFHEAMSPPTGPVMLCLPDDLIDGTVDSRVEMPPKLSPHGPADSTFIKRTANMLATARRPGIIVGNEVSQYKAREEIVRMAEVLGCPVFSEPRPTGLNFPSQHPLFGGLLPEDYHDLGDRLDEYDVLIVLGMQSRASTTFFENGLIPASAVVIQINVDPSLTGRNLACHFSSRSDIESTIAKIRADLQLEVDTDWLSNARQRSKNSADSIKGYRETSDQDEAKDGSELGITAGSLLSAIDESKPAKTSIVNDIDWCAPMVFDYMNLTSSASYFATNGNCLGWAVPAALGVQWANSKATVVCLTGDKSMLFNPQSLWTAAHYGLPVKIVQLNQQGYSSTGTNDIPGIRTPNLSFPKLAESMGVQARSITARGDVKDAIKEMFEHDGPYLLDVLISREIPGLDEEIED